MCQSKVVVYVERCRFGMICLGGVCMPPTPYMHVVSHVMCIATVDVMPTAQKQRKTNTVTLFDDTPFSADAPHIHQSHSLVTPLTLTMYTHIHHHTHSLTDVG